ncbi:MAG: ribosomal RNA small subunit methyltransferase A [Lentisphaeria bacterium]|nr:ribosomal RNA small subunit methyltransferase A [Lentisphaeria bacterium]
MRKKELLTELEKLGMRPGRGLGQNFLIDGNLLDWIVRRAAPVRGEEILEVGPGFGALTGRLLETGARVTAVEFDHRLADYLREKYRDPRLRLVEADACKVDYASLFPEGTAFRAVANLPYAISSVFIARMLEIPRGPGFMLFMLQREMGERLAAVPGSKEYGSLSVRASLDHEVRIEKIVPAAVFYPEPGVESALVSLTRVRTRPPEELRRIAGLTKLVFSRRRKQMGKVLAASYGRERVEKAFAAAGLAWEIRPDRVAPEGFAALAGALA